MSVIGTFIFGFWSGCVIFACGFFLLRGMFALRRERKLRELQRYQEAARKPHNPGTLEQYLRSSEMDGI